METNENNLEEQNQPLINKEVTETSEVINEVKEEAFVPESRLKLQRLQSKVVEVKNEIQKLIIGQHEMIDQILLGVLSRGHILIEGVPGIAKTLTAKIIAKTLNVDFARIQFTPDLMPSDVIGTSFFNVKTSEFTFKKGPIFSNTILIDEINRAPAKTQAALFEAMEERQITLS